MIRIHELEFDENNEAELAAHGVEPQDVWQLLDSRYTVRKNKRSGSGDRRLVGQTHGGRCLTVVLAETPVEGRWRPVTGWDSTTQERGWLQ
jgi:uncharacterized DUF497 family protein